MNLFVYFTVFEIFSFKNFFRILLHVEFLKNEVLFQHSGRINS